MRGDEILFVAHRRPARDSSLRSLYFTAPPLGMLLAAEVFVRVRGSRAGHCAKLHHQNAQRCIFRWGYHAA